MYMHAYTIHAYTLYAGGRGGGTGQKVKGLYTIYVFPFEGCILFMYIYTYSIHSFEGCIHICSVVRKWAPCQEFDWQVHCSFLRVVYFSPVVQKFKYDVIGAKPPYYLLLGSITTSTCVGWWFSTTWTPRRSFRLSNSSSSSWTRTWMYQKMESRTEKNTSRSCLKLFFNLCNVIFN